MCCTELLFCCVYIASGPRIVNGQQSCCPATKGIEGMKMKLSELQKQINHQEDEKATLQRDIEEKMSRLDEINASLSKKTAVRNAYDRTIAEAEAAYAKILESAKALLGMLQRQ